MTPTELPCRERSSGWVWLAPRCFCLSTQPVHPKTLWLTHTRARLWASLPVHHGPDHSSHMGCYGRDGQIGGTRPSPPLPCLLMRGSSSAKGEALHLLSWRPHPWLPRQLWGTESIITGDTLVPLAQERLGGMSSVTKQNDQQGQG